MEKRKLEKREKCSFCTKIIAKHLIPENDNVKPNGVAYWKGDIVHSKCFREFNGQEEFKEGGIRTNYKLENIGCEGEYFQ